MEERNTVVYNEENQGIVIDYEKGVKNPLLKNRRYVGQKEKIGYLLNDVSGSFNIDKYKDRFIYDIVKLDFNFLAVFGLFSGLWDTSMTRLSAFSLTEPVHVGENSSLTYFWVKFLLHSSVCGIGLCRLFLQTPTNHSRQS